MREPVAIQCAEFFYLFSEKGVEMYNGETTAWNFQIEGKLWALSDSKPEPGSRHPCPSFQWFSQQKHAFIVQATSPAEERYKEWRKEFKGGLFIMEPFTLHGLR